jgi:hypothetical protein
VTGPGDGRRDMARPRLPARRAGGRAGDAARGEAVTALLRERSAGATLREAAAAGVHVSTVCRWQARDPGLRQALLDAEREGWHLRRPLPGPRPLVHWRRDCPECGAEVVVRAAPGKLRFWRCDRWPLCGWASWRPRAPRDCRECGSPCYWSHSRKSIGCGTCGVRIDPH